MKVGRFGLGFKSVFHMTGRESSFFNFIILDSFRFSNLSSNLEQFIFDN